ncbi:hypothetical protein Thiowin_04298 [Thiorhodovibrio winogradskyi]|uniref:CDP-archaeol synthase n=1 Tax=Thiorhodovibrio winogradskyi TaxID=77007 RepID=A0ABZ0SDT1_9GAMM|nr:CDP-archaeol synthase [Thiorhodovibrio winogradskyi]
MPPQISQLLPQLFQDTSNIFWLMCPLLMAGILEALLWKTTLFEPLNIPINQFLFGTNKRWRGLVSLPLTHAASVFLFQHMEPMLIKDPPQNWVLLSSFNWLEYGLLVGFVFNLSELPNSYFKRRLKIPSGDEKSIPFFLADNMDSTYGTLLLWYFYFQLPLHLILTGLIVTPLLFMTGTWIRKKLRLK